MNDPQLEPGLAKPLASEEGSFKELRWLVYGLALFVFLTSLAFSSYVYKQNQRMRLELQAANQQATQIEQNPVFQQNRAVIGSLLQEIANQTPAHPEARDILARYGFQVQQQAPAPAAK